MLGSTGPRQPHPVARRADAQDSGRLPGGQVLEEHQGEDFLVLRRQQLPGRGEIQPQIRLRTRGVDALGGW